MLCLSLCVLYVRQCSNCLRVGEKHLVPAGCPHPETGLLDEHTSYETRAHRDAAPVPQAGGLRVSNQDLALQNH